MNECRLICGDALEGMGSLPNASVDLIVADPPYFKVKDRASCAWDHQWKTATDYLEWIASCCAAWRQVLKPNGSLYVFASPQMATAVENQVGEAFNVLNRITWRKEDGWAKRQCKEEQRAYFPASEVVVFAEQYGADHSADDKAGYESKCDELRGSVFEPLRTWFLDSWERSGLTRSQVDRECRCSNVTQYWFLERNYQIPTAEKYAVLKRLAPIAFRREYEDLRREYEDLRRPFFLSSDVPPFTDVWDFPTVQAAKGKHPCEKPASMLRHIVNVSSRADAVVLDPFAGSGVLGEVCKDLGRSYIGFEKDPRWHKRASERIEEHLVMFREVTELPPLFAAQDASLFAEQP